MTSVLPNQPSFWKSRIPLPFSIRGMLLTASKPKPASPLELAQLPTPCHELITRVVKATRLWAGEQNDVARELIAHFRDALESGIDPMQATESFGDPMTAAQSIREAKLKNRPLAWQIARRSLQGGGVLLLVCGLVYGVMAVRYYTSSPNIARNYSKELAARTAAPEEQRAYPVYRTFYINQQKAKIVENFPDLVNVTPEVMPGEAAWADAVKYSKQFAADLEMVRRASAFPTLGAPVTNADDPVVFKEVTLVADPRSQRAEGDENPELMGVLLPYLGWSRMIARSLVVDARVALAEKDVNRCHQNLLALFGVAHQLGAEPFLIGRLVHVAVVALTTQEIRRILTEAPETFSEAQMIDLAHALSAATDGTLKPNIDSERLWMEDWLQRAFTDDGNGDGRLTPEGFNTLNAISGGSSSTQKDIDDSIFYKVASPVIPTVLAGRKELRDTYAFLAAAAEQDAATPRWQRTSYRAETEIEKITQSTVTKARLMPILVFVPSFTKATEACETGVMNRDATLAAIALELHHRRTGKYPATLAELVPAVLPSLPIDMWDGKPLKYRLVDGKPVLYTVGCDKIDNNGAATDDWSVLQGRKDTLRDYSKDKDWLFMPQIRKAPTNLPVKPPAPSTPTAPTTPEPTGTLVYPTPGKS